jgi:glycosyltransferase involved in cell wall biosynthesis
MNVKMKVLVVCTVPFGANGITSVILNYYQMLKNDVLFDFVVINDVNEKYRNLIDLNKSRMYFFKRNKNPLWYIYNMYCLLKKKQYDVVHVHGNSSLIFIDLLAARLVGVPIRIAHSHNTTCSHTFLHKILYYGFIYLYTKGAACSKEAGAWMFGKREFTEIKNGINVNNYLFQDASRKKIRKKYHIDDNIVLGHVGNFIYQKNHIFILKVFGQLYRKNTSYRLLLIGDGPLLQDIKDMAMELGLSQAIVFCGKTMNVPAYLDAMDLFVLPSYFEGLPVALLEAQASGLPCVVSNKVTSDAKISKEVCFESIENAEQWEKTITKMLSSIKGQNRKYYSNVCCDNLKEKGYDINCSAHMLINLYKSNEGEK